MYSNFELVLDYINFLFEHFLMLPTKSPKQIVSKNNRKAIEVSASIPFNYNLAEKT